MKIIWGVASGGDHLIKSRKGSSQIESIVATANEESNSMHGEIVIEIVEVTYFTENP